MKKTVFYIIIALLFVHCNSNSLTEKENKIDSNLSTVVEQKDIKTIKTVQRDSLKKIEFQKQLKKRDALKNIDIRALLAKPIDFKHYMSLKGEANSSGFTNNGKYYQPEYRGFYYQYFLFGKRGSSRLCVRTYVKGSKVRGSIQKGDILVGLIEEKEDKDLGVLDLVNRTRDEIVKAYGKPDYEDEQLFVYWSGKNCLALIKNDLSKVAEMWFSKTNKEINSLEDIHEDIRTSIR